jgi:hypothetical protein
LYTYRNNPYRYIAHIQFRGIFYISVRPGQISSVFSGATFDHSSAPHHSSFGALRIVDHLVVRHLTTLQDLISYIDRQLLPSYSASNFCLNRLCLGVLHHCAKDGILGVGNVLRLFPSRAHICYFCRLSLFVLCHRRQLSVMQHMPHHARRHRQGQAWLDVDEKQPAILAYVYHAN